MPEVSYDIGLFSLEYYNKHARVHYNINLKDKYPCALCSIFGFVCEVVFNFKNGWGNETLEC
jgi:hypothetical protein